MWVARVPVSHPRDEDSSVVHKSIKVRPPTGLMLLIVMCGDVAMNPGPAKLGLVNARSIQNKGPLLADTIASHFLCLTETHIRTTDSDSFLHSLTPDGSH